MSIHRLILLTIRTLFWNGQKTMIMKSIFMVSRQIYINDSASALQKIRWSIFLNQKKMIHARKSLHQQIRMTNSEENQANIRIMTSNGKLYSLASIPSVGMYIMWNNPALSQNSNIFSVYISVRKSHKL